MGNRPAIHMGNCRTTPDATLHEQVAIIQPRKIKASVKPPGVWTRYGTVSCLSDTRQMSDSLAKVCPYQRIEKVSRLRRPGHEVEFLREELLLVYRWC